MNKELYSHSDIETKGPATNILGKAVRRSLLALGILGLAATSSGCLWVRDDEGHHHWRWHHEDHPVDHHDVIVVP